MNRELKIDIRIVPAFGDAKILIPLDMTIGSKTVRKILEMPTGRFLAFMKEAIERKAGPSEASE